MSRKSWDLDRRTLLRGSGVAIALPWLEGMAVAESSRTAELPKRFCAVYWPFGVAMPGDKAADRNWGWFPTGAGKDFQFTDVLSPMEPLRDQVTVIGGISHPNGWAMGGHDTGDVFLTGAKYRSGSYLNSISLDQQLAEVLGQRTRFASLTLSSDGGIGEPTRACTLSYTREGRPIPAISSPRQIFDRLFGQERGESAELQRRRLTNSTSMLDRLLDHSRSLGRRLGKQDQQKLDQYLESVRDVERRVGRAQAWLDVPKPEVDTETLNLEANPDAPKEYIRAIYDLMFLAFQTDSTRVATYMIGQVAGATTIANAFPACLGLQGNWHGLAHGAGKPGGAEKLGKFDQFLAGNHARFLQRLSETQEGDGSILDSTMVLYGSSNSRTHQNHNYPLLLAGGRGLGVRHGQYLRYNETEMRLSNLFLTILDRLDVPVSQFSDSTGEFSDILV